MKARHLLQFISLFIAILFFASCNNKKTEAAVQVKQDTVATQPVTPPAASMETDTREGLTVKTYWNASGNADSIVLSNDKSNILVARPTMAIARGQGMSDTLYNCLKKCKNPDGSYDINCIVLCPPKARLQVVTRY